MADDVAVSGGTLINRRTSQEVDLDLDFETSPLVPNPADPNSQSAASIGEVEQLIQESSAGFIRSMDPKTALSAAVSNTTTETSLLDAVQSQPRLTNAAVYRMVAGGLCRATAGGPVNMTLRRKNTTDGTTLASAVVSLITDAQGSRPWRFDVSGEGAVVIADSVLSTAALTVGAGDATPLVQAMGQAAIAIGTDPQNWDLTLQFSVANAGILAFVYSAQVIYALPGA
jgi:hypothetical protein